jgi:hypothetical protein
VKRPLNHHPIHPNLWLSPITLYSARL